MKAPFTRDLSPENIDRRDFVLRILDTYSSRGSLLEIGCANGKYGRLLSPHLGRYVGLDAIRDLVRMAHEGKNANEQYVVAFGEQLPFTGPFDCVLFGRSLHYALHPGRPRDFRPLEALLTQASAVTDLIIVTEPNEDQSHFDFSNRSIRSEEELAMQMAWKLHRLRHTRKYLTTQTQFEVVEQNLNPENKDYRWVFRKK